MLLFSFGLNAQKDSIEISLLTYSPGKEIYGAFGHSALRIQNFDSHQDILYNYGIFSFGNSVTDFVWKFLRGKLKYKLGKENTSRVLRYYKAKGNKRITEQKLLLNQEEKHLVLEFLETNYLPENREYYYDFFFDNCATRIRDILEKVLGDSFQYKENLKTNLTLRQLLDVHIESRPWEDFGMDLLIGIPSDKMATYQEQMFLPEFLSDNLSKGAEMIRTDSTGMKTKQALFTPATVLLDGEYYKNEPSLFRPFVIFGGLCLIMLILTIIYTHNRLLANLDSILFLLLGIIGVFLLFMWFGTDHLATKWNMNILWANPLYLFLFNPVRKMNPISMKWTYGMTIFCNLLILLTWGFFPQQFHLGIIPIVMMLLVRSSAALVHLKRSKNSL